MKFLKKHPLLKLVNNSLVDLPTPSNISAWWNFGSLLGMCLILEKYEMMLYSKIS